MCVWTVEAFTLVFPISWHGDGLVNERGNHVVCFMLTKGTCTMKCNTQLTTTSEPPPTVDAVGGTPEHLDCQNVLPMGGPLADTIKVSKQPVDSTAPTSL